MSKAKYTSTESVKLQCKKAMEQLQGYNEAYTSNGIDPVIRHLVNEAVDVAKTTLRSTDHRQSMGDKLVDEIGGYSGGGKGAVVAPFNNNDRKVRNQMYYAEYGAGIYSNGTKTWKYPSSSDDKAEELVYSKERRSVARAGRAKTLLRHKEGYKYHTTTGKWVGVTNWSEPAKYMEAAREYLVQNARGRIAERISQNLAKPLHRQAHNTEGNVYGRKRRRK